MARRRNKSNFDMFRGTHDGDPPDLRVVARPPKKQERAKAGAAALLDAIRKCGAEGLRLTPGVTQSLRDHHGLAIHALDNLLRVLVRNGAVAIEEDRGVRVVRATRGQ